MGRREEGTHQPIEYEPRFARLTTVTRVLGDKPPTDGLFTEEMRMDYDYLAHLEILAAKVPDHKTGDEHFVFVSEPLDGDAILHLLYHAAPSKNEFYRYDRNDLLNDWNSLYQDNDLQRARLERHRRIPGWSHFEKRRAEIRGVIDQKTDTYLNPTVVLTRNSDGELTFNYDEDHRITSTVWEQGGIGQLWLGPVSRPEDMVTALGPAYIAAFSRDIRHDWEKTVHYPQPEDRGAQTITTAQSLPYALWRADTLIGAPLTQALIDHTETAITS